MIALTILLLALQATPELRQHVDAGLKAKAAGDLETAIREFKRVAELAPNLAAAHVNLGAVYLARKNYPEAVRALRNALTIEDHLPGAHGMMGTALLAQGYAAEAIPHLEKGDSQDLLGVALLETGRAREALDRLEAALLKRPDDPDLLFYIGEAHAHLSREVFERLRRTNPNSARAHQMLGEYMANTGNRTSAEEHFADALAARPDLPGVHFSLGELFLESGDYDRAEKEFRAEVQMLPGSAAAAYKLGLVLLNRGRVGDAVTELRRADQLQPGMPETLLELGKAMNASGDAASAAKYLEEVLKAENNTKLAATAHFQLAQAYRKLGRVADAEREMKQFQEKRTSAPDSR